MIVLGIGHYSRTGKDTFAKYLIAELNKFLPEFRVARMAFGSKLKDICHQLYGWAGMREEAFYETAEGAALRDVPLPFINKSPVQIWIDMGTPAVRDSVYDRTWIDYLLNTDHKLDMMLIADTRFYNEVGAIREAGGWTIKVVRPGIGPRKSPADRQLLCARDWDYVIGESGQLSEIHRWASLFAQWMCGAPRPIQTESERQAAYAVERIEPWHRDHEWLKPYWYIDAQHRLVNSWAGTRAA